MNITNEQKVEILRQALDERYKSIHIIRERVQNISLWVLALFITVGGWLLQSDTTLTMREHIFFSILIGSSVLFLHIFYVNDLEKGFKAQQRIQAKIEDLLGLCTPGVYSQDSVYPKEWAKAGTKDGKGNFFFHNYLIIYFATATLLICLWIK